MPNNEGTAIDKRILNYAAEVEAFAEERRKLLDRARGAEAEAARADRMRDELLRKISHELRTPLNAILGWTQMLLAGDLEASMQRHAIETIQRNAENQNRIIENLLDATRILNGNIKIEPRRFSLDSLIAAAIAAAQPRAAAKHLNIESIVDDSTLPIYADQQRLMQALLNVVDNAIKFTPRDGSIKIKAQTADSFAEIAVEDTGVGIKPENIELIFDCFRHSDGGEQPQPRLGSLGLGLPVAKRLVEVHGGTLTAESAGENQGAIFRLKMPLDLSAAIVEELPDEPNAANDLNDAANQVH